MELLNIPNNGYWTDIARNINTNFKSVSDGIEGMKKDVTMSKGLYPTLADLEEAWPEAINDSWALVGTSFPAKIYQYDESLGEWTDTGKTATLPGINLNDFSESEVLSDPRSILDDYLN